MNLFTGQLRSNVIFGALFNMIINQIVFSDPIKGLDGSLVDKAKVEGGLYGDSIVLYSSDALKSFEWGNDAESVNLLALYRPEAPKQQVIVMDVFRQIPVTVDYYLSKQAWATEGAFMQFISVTLGWIANTKKIYDVTTYNSFIGTHISEASKATVTIDVESAIGEETGVEAKNRIEAQCIAENIENLFTNLKDVSRDYNDYQFLRAYDPNDLVLVWNSKFANKIKKTDVPTIFHKDNLIYKFEEEVLPARYFGDIGDADIALANNDGTKRSMIEADYASAVGEVPTHVFPGDLIPAKTAKVLTLNGTNYGSTAKTISSGIAANEYYTENENRIAVLMAKGAKSVPYMSAFSVGTNFFNAKSLTENHYLTFGHNTLDHVYEYPFIRIEKKSSSNKLFNSLKGLKK